MKSHFSRIENDLCVIRNCIYLFLPEKSDSKELWCKVVCQGILGGLSVHCSTLLASLTLFFVNAVATLLEVYSCVPRIQDFAASLLILLIFESVGWYGSKHAIHLNSDTIYQQNVQPWTLRPSIRGTGTKQSHATWIGGLHGLLQNVLCLPHVWKRQETLKWRPRLLYLWLDTRFVWRVAIDHFDDLVLFQL